MSRYAIWDKTSNIYTPVGEELTAEQWLNRYAFLSWIPQSRWSHPAL
jgi:hypothetical protein